MKKLKFYKLSSKSPKKTLTNTLFRNKKIRKQLKKLEEGAWEWEVVTKLNNKNISRISENPEKAKSQKRKKINPNKLSSH
jgi:hypothetical protein